MQIYEGQYLFHQLYEFNILLNFSFTLTTSFYYFNLLTFKYLILKMNGAPVSPVIQNGDTNFDALIQLLTHNETNYAFFAVSRIKIISQIIGPAKTRKDLVPQLKKLIAQKDLLDYEIKQLVTQVVLELQEKQ